ncbi:DNA/RNA non-specific endonuclease [Flavobacterium daejeonense]|uniref:DNA/RNA non-specific endonuclease n=1 Tax=Flavobacterium daejeonense TaxID=350893 RepID=UPI00047D0621|nr:DNA/RNA non-specific endonuclease [Flavobacterium daejeonense]
MNKKFGVLFVILGFVFLACKQKETLKFSDEKIKVVDIEGKQSAQDLNFYLPKSANAQIVKHDYFTLSYNENAEQAEWVAYELKKDYVKNSDFKRPFFIEDPKVSSQSADWRSYKNSGYDKGHLCPAADMEFNLSAYKDTFFTSNISPQNHDFNSGIWNRLEQKIRFWAVKYDGLIVVTGGVLKGNLKTIGSENVKVPEYFYKIALNYTKGNYKVIAFLVPNKKSSKSIFDYVVSVDEIESKTGIDFFPKLEDKLENSLEKNVNLNSWLSK